MAIPVILLVLAALQAQAQQSSTASVPRPATSPSDWVVSDDYPSQAFHTAQAGVVGFRLNIDAAGKVTGCVVTQSSGSSILDSTTCQLMARRARFLPATGENGQPIAGSWQSRFRWTLPEGTVPTFENWSELTQFRMAADGRIDFCSTRSFNLSPAALVPLCERLQRGEQPIELNSFRAAMRGQSSDLAITEFGVDADGLPPQDRRAYDAPGRKLRSLDSVNFALTADGRVGTCGNAAHSGDAARTIDLCERLRAIYATGAPHGFIGAGTAWFAISTGASDTLPDFLKEAVPMIVAPTKR